jgi:hypothetical protein
MAAAPGDFRAVVAPLGASLAGTLAMLVGAWGAICVFVGPTFGYRPTSYNAWEWTTQNWLLHLVPGAVGFVAGIMVIEETRRRKVGAGGTLGIPALLLMAAGIWFVIGPAVWPTFESGPAFATGVSAGTAALNVIGSSLGPGLLLAILGGMAWKAGIARPAVAVEPGPAAAPVAEPVPDREMATSTGTPLAETAAARGPAGPGPAPSRTTGSAGAPGVTTERVPEGETPAGPAEV